MVYSTAVRRVIAFSPFLGLMLVALSAAGQPTPGYSERVLQWTVQKGETCADIAQALYGGPQHSKLLQRYNSIVCGKEPIAAGTTLVVPEKVTELPPATLRSMNPDVRARPPSGAWSAAVSGMPLQRQYSVNTLSEGRADIRFIDRTRVVLAENTLVVIFGTAGQSQVSKTSPARVQLNEGEMRTGLAALRGDSVEVDVGGGRVSAQSRDTVVKKKSSKTTVSVYDGSAKVESGGTTVSVPAHMGTTFVEAKPPTPPRPLPPPPAWEDSAASGIIVAPEGVGTLKAAWNPVPSAKAYRFEIATNKEFTDYVVREEVPNNVLAFRAEKIPAGTYHLRVQAIDNEDFLGIPSAARDAVLVDTRVLNNAGEVKADHITVHPYGAVLFGASQQIEMGIDTGPFGPVIANLDLRQRTPNHIRFRQHGSKQTNSLPIHYVDSSISIEPGKLNEAGDLPVKVVFTGFEGIDIPERVGPVLRAHVGGDVVVIPLSTSQEKYVYSSTVPVKKPIAGSSIVRLDVMDGRARVLGTAYAELIGPEDEPKKERQRPTDIAAPPYAISNTMNAPIWAPGARSSGHVGGSITAHDGTPIGQMYVAALGRHGPLAFDARVATNALGSSDVFAPDTSAWTGLRWTAAEQQISDEPEINIVFEPSLKVGFPMGASAPSPRIEPSAAIGGFAGRYSWLFDLGFRVRLGEEGDRAHVPPLHVFAMLGGTYGMTSWIRLYSALEGHIVNDSGAHGRLAAVAGAETTGLIFGSLSARLSPWEDAGGYAAGYIAIGVRDSK